MSHLTEDKQNGINDLPQIKKIIRRSDWLTREYVIFTARIIKMIQNSKWGQSYEILQVDQVWSVD